MTGYWQYFHYWETLLITLIGGFFGVLFSIPLRRVMLNYPNLNFPEGTAIGNVLKASGTGKGKMKYLVNGGLGGGLIVLFQTGFKVLSESFQVWILNGKTLLGLSLGFSPALLAAGFIVGIQACIALLVGIILGWVIGVPVYSQIYGLPAVSSYYDMAMTLRADHIRYIGVGVMLLGGAWTLVTLIKPIVTSLSMSIRSLHQAQRGAEDFRLPRTERDIPMSYVIFGRWYYRSRPFLCFYIFLAWKDNHYPIHCAMALAYSR